MVASGPGKLLLELESRGERRESSQTLGNPCVNAKRREQRLARVAVYQCVGQFRGQNLSSLDSSFGTNGIGTSETKAAIRTFSPVDLALQPDGKVVIAGGTYVLDAPNVGNWSFALARFYGDPALLATSSAPAKT